MRAAARLLAALTVVAGALGLLATPVAAHNVSGVGSTNYLTTLDGLAPETAGISVAVLEKGSRIEVTNTNEDDVVVLGYEGEPYLRIGPDGVFENQRSPATYLNRDRSGSDSGGAEVDAEAEPDWEQISAGRTARWHDHRIHWMAPSRAPQTGADGAVDLGGPEGGWTVDLLVDDVMKLRYPIPVIHVQPPAGQQQGRGPAAPKPPENPPSPDAPTA